MMEEYVSKGMNILDSYLQTMTHGEMLVVGTLYVVTLLIVGWSLIRLTKSVGTFISNKVRSSWFASSVEIREKELLPASDISNADLNPTTTTTIEKLKVKAKYGWLNRRRRIKNGTYYRVEVTPTVVPHGSQRGVDRMYFDDKQQELSHDEHRTLQMAYMTYTQNQAIKRSARECRRLLNASLDQRWRDLAAGRVKGKGKNLSATRIPLREETDAHATLPRTRNNRDVSRQQTPRQYWRHSGSAPGYPVPGYNLDKRTSVVKIRVR